VGEVPFEAGSAGKAGDRRDIKIAHEARAVVQV
jgi:hypothetical protein